jgi:putative ABC transport system permease protein
MSAPRLARLLIRLAAGSAHREDALGDLEETHRRRQLQGRVHAWLGSMAESLVIALTLLWHRPRPPYATRSMRPGRMSLTDFRLGFRLMVRQPLTAVTAVVALTVGIALANVGFAATEALLFSRLPFEGGDRFVRLRAVDARDRRPLMLSAESYVRLQSGVSALEHIGAYNGRLQSAMLPSGQAVELTVTGITATSLHYVPGVPLRGRPLLVSDGALDAAPVTVISEDFWRGTLGASEDVVGATMAVGTVRRTIVGVMPASFKFPNAPAAWVPLDERFRKGDALLESDGRLFAILAPGATLSTASAQLLSLASQLQATADTEGVSPEGVRVDATLYTDAFDLAGPMAAMILLAVVAVLVVLAASVGNLVLVRSFARAREFAVRAAMGASRARLVLQVMSEVLVIGGVSALLGSLVGQAILRQLNGLEELPFWVDFTGSFLTATMVAGATLFATAIAGAWPALKATRQDVLAGLRSGDGRTSDVTFGRAAGFIVVTQIALSVVMLHAALVVAQALRSYSTPAVSLPSNVLTAGMVINGVRVATDGTRSTPVSAGEVERFATAMPGVLAAGLSTALPRHSPEATRIEVEPLQGTPALPDKRAPSASVSPTFFDVLGAKVLSGRNFTAADSLPGAPPVAIVNEPFVRDILGGSSPVGRRIRATHSGQTGPWRHIVGVVPDLGLSLGDPALAAGYYTPLNIGEEPAIAYLAMRTSGEPMTYAEPLRRWLRERDPGLNMFPPERLEDVAQDDRGFFTVLSSALSGVGAITLSLALVGVYSMMSLIVTRRTREIGIRVALGATPSLVIRSVARRAALQMLAGGVIGAALALLSLRGRSMFVSRLSDGGTWTLPFVIALLVLAGLTATWVPLRRALRIRPQEALKAE